MVKIAQLRKEINPWLMNRAAIRFKLSEVKAGHSPIQKGHQNEQRLQA
jgi:hypothetical protein